MSTVGEVIRCAIQICAEQDLCPWLESAYSSLIGAELFPKIPTFDIMRLSKARVYTVQKGYPELNTFMLFIDETCKLTGLTDGLKNASVEPGVACKELEAWHANCKKIYCLAPAVESKLTPIQVKLSGMAEQFYRDSLKRAMSKTSKLLLAIANADPHAKVISEADLTAAVHDCNSASLLATGFANSDDKHSSLTSISLAKHMLEFCHNMSINSRRSALSNFSNMAKVCNISFEAGVQSTSVQTKIMYPELQKAHTLICESTALSWELFITLLAACMS